MSKAPSKVFPSRASKASGKTRQRSPNYPAVGLRRAVDLSQKLWDSDKRQAVLPSRAFATFGFTPKSSAGPVTISAMKKFGLLIEEGEGNLQKIKLTEDAIQILNQSSASREQLIKNAALKPQIHRDLWQKYGTELPSDGALHDYLVFERKFIEEAGNALITQYRDTIAFAKLVDSDNVPDVEIEETDKNDVPPSPPVGMPKQEQPVGSGGGNPPRLMNHTATLIDFPVPLPSGVVAYFRLPASVSDADFSFYTALLAALKPGIVKVPPPPRSYPAKAIWNNKNSDQPVTVTGEKGIRDGALYLSVEESDTGVPASQVRFL